MSKNLIFLTFIFIAVNSLAQGLSPERVAKIKASTVRVTLEGTALMGSGFTISKDGQIATCWHVIEPAIKIDQEKKISVSPIYVEFEDGSKLKVSIPTYYFNNGYENAKAFDYCVLVPDVSPQKDLPFLKIGSFNNIQTGEEVYTCGYPLGITQQFITKGILSTKMTQNYLINKKLKIQSVGLFDITLNKGNSGGPIIKIGKTIDDDEVIAMADFIINPTGSGVEIEKAIDNLTRNSGAIIMQNVDTNKELATLLKYVSSTSVGISGGMAIDHFVKR